MDARQLEYFLAIVDHDGFVRAAEHLHVAQPSLSQAIAKLERELGVALFHRIGRGVILSRAGSELVEPARQVLRDLRTARASMESMKGLQRGSVELVAMPSPGIEPLSTLIRRFTRHYPGIRVEVGAAFTPEEVVDDVRQGRCELGLAGSPGPRFATTPGAGAAGGLGFAGLLLGGHVVSGADYFLDLLQFDTHLDGCDLVITGEGRIDDQTLHGKLPAIVAQRAAPLPVVAVVGRNDLSKNGMRAIGLEAVHAVADRTDLNPAGDPALTAHLLAELGRTMPLPACPAEMPGPRP